MAKAKLQIILTYAHAKAWDNLIRTGSPESPGSGEIIPGVSDTSP